MLFDTGCSSAAILTVAAESVKLDFQTYLCKLSTFDNDKCSLRDFASFEILSLDRSVRFSVKDALVGESLTVESERAPTNFEIAPYDYLDGVRFNELDDPTVGVILGAPYSWLWATGETRFHSPDYPLAKQSSLGWFLIGPSFEKVVGPVVAAAPVDFRILSLRLEIKRMFRHDYIMPGVREHAETVHPSRQDEFAREQMRKAITIKLDRYSVPLPWRNGRAEAARKFALTDSYTTAKNRLLRLRVKFEKDNFMRDNVFDQIEKWKKMGNVREVVERDLSGRPVWYSPVLCVLQPNKPVHKRYRFCQDSGAVSYMSEGPMWLNAELSTGPDVLPRLTSILFKFRRKPVVLMGDIADFFHRIWVDDEDVAALRFLFFKDRSLKEIIALEMLVHIFGAGSSPCVANFTLQFHAERIREKYGEFIYLEVMTRFYVDDYLSSVGSVEEAREVKSKLTEALAVGGFELTKWDSNYPEVLIDSPSLISPTPQGLPAEDVAPSVPVSTAGSSDVQPEVRVATVAAVNASISDETGEEGCVLFNVETPSDKDRLEDLVEEESFSAEWKDFAKPDVDSSVRVLGVGYDKKQDILFVRIPKQADKEAVTMTDMLSIVSSYFDPLGLSAPYCLAGRLLFQECNRRGIGWKDRIPLDLLPKFIAWVSNRDGLRQISVPRWTSSWELTDSFVDLCVFGDSSKDAYGACAYLRRYLPDESVVLTRLVFGKGHVVPTSMHVDKLDGQYEHNDSIPRCELTAARLAAEICSLVQREESDQFNNIYLFTDSMSILLWIRDMDKKHKTFEKFRLQRIWNLSEVSWWRHCPTLSNPSDVLTHPLSCRPRDAERWDLYLNGPSWMKTTSALWPKEPSATAEKIVSIATLNALCDYDTKELFPPRLLARRGPRAPSSSAASSESSVLIAASSEVVEPSVTDVPSLHPVVAASLGVGVEPDNSGGHSYSAPDVTEPSDMEIVVSTASPLQHQIGDLPTFRFAPASASIAPLPLETSTDEVEGAEPLNFLLQYTEINSKWAEKVNRINRLRDYCAAFRDYRRGRTIRLNARRFASPSEFASAEKLLICAIQAQYFSVEIDLLLRHAVFSPNGANEFGDRQSNLTNLNPFLDGDLIMRSGSRIEKADAQFDLRFPIILPPKSPEVLSLIRHEHEIMEHIPSVHLFHHLNRKYFIMGGKAAVAHVLRYCVGCQCFDKLPTCQKMAILPDSRVTLIWPFRSCALDVLGPYSVTHAGRGLNKRYVLLLTCPATRALALFPLVDMSTQSFLNALTKFQSVYPGVQQIICDQGTNFVGASNLCKELVEEFNSGLKGGELLLRNVEFRFNCPYASHTGGVFERLVRNVKRSLHFILDSHPTNFDAFDTALHKCAFILNSRPLCYSSNDVESTQCLSPQNFLTPYQFNAEFTMDPPVTVSSECLRGSWHDVRQIVDHFKERWVKEYLITLRTRQKWHKYQTEFYVGQLVLISGPNTPRTHWNMGRVEEKLQSVDGITRRYKVKLSDGRVFERHHNVLVPLELEYE